MVMDITRISTRQYIQFLRKNPLVTFFAIADIVSSIDKLLKHT